MLDALKFAHAEIKKDHRSSERTAASFAANQKG